MNNNTDQKKADRQTFWKLIGDNNYTIKIPRIQRDYAQGRTEAEPTQIRNAFLKDIFSSLSTGKRMDINFIYGNIEAGNNGEQIFVPIDGQQRLTTLFLLHWYFALWNGQLNDENKKILSRFQYDTRFVAGNFCKRLVEEVDIPLKEIAETEKRITDIICDYYWFFSAFERDATIKAMLVMLESIHEAVKTVEHQENVDTYFDLLCGSDCPINFLFLDIADAGLTDEIYIKMNARGKALTRFENFKAQLSGYLAVRDDDFSKKFIGDINGIWSQFFWNPEYRPYVETVNEKDTPRKAIIFDKQILNMFRFIMTNEYITRVDFKDEKQNLQSLTRTVLSAISKETDFEFLSHLFLDEYRVVNKYDSHSANVDIDTFRKIYTFMNVLVKKKEETGNICFIDETIYNNKFIDEELFFKRMIKADEKALPMEDQLVVWAEILFLAQYSEPDYSFYKTEELTHWIRFIYNISRNILFNQLDDYQRSAKRTRLLVESGDALNILDYCSKILKRTYKDKSGYGFAELAMEEECIKAQLIHMSVEWKNAIDNAEKSFLGSQIGALLSFSGIWALYENETEKYEVEHLNAIAFDGDELALTGAVSDNSYIDTFISYLSKINLIFSKDGLRPEMEKQSILRRALLTYGGKFSYMLPANSHVKCFLSDTDRDNSFKRLFRDDNKSKEDSIGSRAYFKYLLDDIDENKDISEQLLIIIENASFEGESEWKRYFVEMPEILESLTKRNPMVTEKTAVFKNPQRYICIHSNNQVLLLEKKSTSSNNREYYSYVVYLKALAEGVDMQYHKEYGEDSSKFTSFVNKENQSVNISYALKDNNEGTYCFIAKVHGEEVYSTPIIRNVLDYILENYNGPVIKKTNDTDFLTIDKSLNTVIEKVQKQDDSEFPQIKASVEIEINGEDMFFTGEYPVSLESYEEYQRTIASGEAILESDAYVDIELDIADALGVDYSSDNEYALYSCEIYDPGNFKRLNERYIGTKITQHNNFSRDEDGWFMYTCEVEYSDLHDADVFIQIQITEEGKIVAIKEPYAEVLFKGHHFEVYPSYPAIFDKLDYLCGISVEML